MNKLKLFEEFLNKKEDDKYSDYENLSKLDRSGEVSHFTRNRILDVNNFTEWFIKNKLGKKGDIKKLTPNIINEYFYDQGVECDENEVNDFIQKIKKEW